MSDERPRLYVVIRKGWHEYEGTFTQGEDDTGTPVRVFPTREVAVAFARESQRADRRYLVPFRFEHEAIELLSSLETDEAMCEAVRALGLEPPTPTDRGSYEAYDWVAWWDERAGDFTPQQRDAVWDLCDRLELYTVVDAPLED